MRALLPCLALLACSPSGRIRTAPPASQVDTALQGTGSGSGTTAVDGPCPDEHMAWVEADAGAFCIDLYEAGLQDWSPYEVPSGGQIAIVAPGMVPQGYISGDRAAEACALAGKRLCALDEWLRACQGPQGSTFPYGEVEDPDACNTSRANHPVVDLFGANTDWSPEQMNDPQVNQQPDTVDPGGANPDCVSADGVFDLHGNLHEWVDDPGGIFKGGFYADAAINGAGCLYATTAHTPPYHDYSTGFRCCAEPTP